MREFLIFIGIYITAFLPGHSASFIDRKAEGWHWFEDKPVTKQEDSKPQESPTPPKKQKTPSEQLKDLKKELETALHTAIMNPNYENVRQYQIIQKQVADRAEVFSKRWMEVIFTNPSLDYTVLHPTNQAARHIYLDEQSRQIQEGIKKLSKTHGLFFFFKSDCAYCHKFAPIVKHFSETYGWKVLAISMDGSKLPEFPDAVSDNGVSKRFNITSLPTLLAVNPDTGKNIPLSVGLASIEEIEKRVRVLYLERSKNEKI